MSKDGYRFKDVNNANAIIAGDTIAEQKGIRDPYILRGPDGLFYMALTDLHLRAQKAGYRTTQLERGQAIRLGKQPWVGTFKNRQI